MAEIPDSAGVAQIIALQCAQERRRCIANWNLIFGL